MGRPARRPDRGAAAGTALAVFGPQQRAPTWSQFRLSLVDDKLEAEAAGLGRISAGSVAGAARALHTAERIWIAGFRSCRSVAELLNYQLRLFRPDEVQLVGGSGPEDLDLGAFHPGDAVVVIGFAPYSIASVLSARAAHQSGATLVAIADTLTAPMAEGAEHACCLNPRPRRDSSRA
jgi:Transcriptional regulators